MTAATGVVPDSAGKPASTMYEMAVRDAGAREALVVGDRLDTDLAGARTGGFAGLHVLTGVSTARDDVLAPAGLRPHYIAADLGGLLVAHPVPTRGAEGWWVCGDAAARVVDGRLDLGSAPAGIDLVRAACAAAWAATDDGVDLDASSVPDLRVPDDAGAGTGR